MVLEQEQNELLPLIDPVPQLLGDLRSNIRPFLPLYEVQEYEVLRTY